MISPILTSRFIIFAPKKGVFEDTSYVQLLESICRDQSLRVLRTQPYFIACETSVASEDIQTEHPYLIGDVLPGKRVSQRTFGFRTDELDWKNWHQIAESQAQYYNLLYSDASSFTVESDILGIKQLYLADTSFGTLISSKLIDIFRFDKTLVRPIDRIGLAQLILTGHPFGSRTLHSKVRRTATGERLHWDNSSHELSSSRPRRIDICAEVKSHAGLVESVHHIDKLISRSISRCIDGISTPLNIGLSGGFDSRILAAVLKKQRPDFNAFTYGHWHHREVLTAKKIAKILEIQHKILPYPVENHYNRMDLFLNTLEGQSDSTSVQIANLLQMDTPDGTPVFHGFMSDAVAVTRFSDQKDGVVPQNLDEAAINIASSIVKSPEHLQFISNLVEADITEDSICNEVRSDMMQQGLSYHSAVLWDVENRQRRFIAGHIPMLGQKFDIITPFYDKDLMSFWLSLPRISLDERYLQRQQLAKLYPELAKIPHSEESTPIIPNLSNQLQLLVDTTLRKIFVTPFQKYTGYRTSNIWSLSGGMATNELRRYMTRLFLDNLESVDSVFDLSSFKDSEVEAYFEVGPAKGDYITPRVVFQTTAYAKWLRDSLH